MSLCGRPFWWCQLLVADMYSDEVEVRLEARCVSFSRYLVVRQRSVVVVMFSGCAMSSSLTALLLRPLTRAEQAESQVLTNDDVCIPL
jgi:hypothetical protein